MNIIVDMHNINFTDSGIGIFESQLISRLCHYDDMNLSGLVNFRRADSKSNYTRFPFPVKYSYLPYKVIYNKPAIKLPLSYEHIAGKPCDVNLFLTYRLPRVYFRKPVISCIHDILALKTPMENQEITNEYRKTIVHTLKNTDLLLTVSESSKKDLIDNLNVKPEKIHIIYNAIDHSEYSKVYTDSALQSVREKYKLPNKFILYFGGLRRHKNIPNLVRAYALLGPTIRSEVKLVITKGNDEIKKLITDLKIDHDVYFTGYVDEADKVALYKMAEVSSYISLYEGFGVPIIEAQAAGTPVITSNLSSMPEAAGGAAILVDPNNPEEISSNLEKLLNDRELRQQLIAKGRANAQKYNWDDSAGKLRNLILTLK